MITRAILLLAVLATGCHFGVSYTSEWSKLTSKSGVQVGGDNPDAYPDHTGSVRLNVITISDDTGWLRAAGMAAGSVAEEVTRREHEAASNGGYYHREEIATPEVVPGGRTRLAVAWGSSDKWTEKVVSYTDSISPRQIGDGSLYWAVEADVVMGSVQHHDWKESDIEFRAQVGPVFGTRLGRVGELELSTHIGVLIDPVFKPCAALLIDGIPYLDLTTYASIDAIAVGHLTLGARVAYDRGQMLLPSSSISGSVTAGVVF